MLTAVCVLYDGDRLLFVCICRFRFRLVGFCFWGVVHLCVCLYVHFVQKGGDMYVSISFEVCGVESMFVYFGILIL